MKSIRILGTRGIPAAHGGFETFAEKLALHLTSQNWRVTVYCQESGSGAPVEDTWNGIRRIRIPVRASNSIGSIIFDLLSTIHASKESGPILTLGYNTAIFSAIYKLTGRKNLINMDGVEWKRKKWGRAAKLWFWMNDWAGSLLADHLIADHPEIAAHLSTRTARRRITTISYGADKITSAPEDLIRQHGLKPRRYAIIIARPEPENSILEMVRAWSRKPRGYQLVILGKYDERNTYHKSVIQAASHEVDFLGAIYQREVVQALRFHASFYLHGHQAGGTNPSLVEALGASNPVIAHNNPYNRWVAGDGALYFSDEHECSDGINRLINDDHLRITLQIANESRHLENFTWPRILSEYTRLLSEWQ